MQKLNICIISLQHDCLRFIIGTRMKKNKVYRETMSELNVAIIYPATPLATSPHSTDNWQWLINKHTKCLELFIYIFHDLVYLFYYVLLQVFFT